MLDKRLLLLRPTDNVCVAGTAIAAGTRLLIDGVQAELDRDAPTGFKIARFPIAASDQVFKHGAPIGSATADIAPGEIVHTHNLKSDYIETYTLDAARRRAEGGEAES